MPWGNASDAAIRNQELLLLKVKEWREPANHAMNVFILTRFSLQ